MEIRRLHDEKTPLVSGDVYEQKEGIGYVIVSQLVNYDMTVLSDEWYVLNLVSGFVSGPSKGEAMREYLQSFIHRPRATLSVRD